MVDKLQETKATFSKTELKTLLIAILGGSIEFYDFIIYGIFSVYFAHQFFPSNNNFVSIIASYAVFFVGYIARPVGGILFGYIGEKHGKQAAMSSSIALMAIGSVGIGLCPVYSQIGIFAPLALLLFRLMQGLSYGGELPSTIVYLSETLKNKQGSVIAFTMIGVHVGILLGMFFNQLLNMLMPLEEIRSYGWRLPFIFGAVICVIVLYGRSKSNLDKTAHSHTKNKLTLFELIKKSSFSLLLSGFISSGIMFGIAGVYTIFMATYLVHILHIDSKVVSHIMSMSLMLSFFAMYFAGVVANKVSIYKIVAFSAILDILLIPIAFYLMSIDYIFTGVTMLALLEGLAATTIPIFLTKIFDDNTRLLGVSICYNSGITLFAGLAPLLITLIINFGVNIYLAPVIYLFCIVFFALFAVLYLKNLSLIQG